MACFAAGNQDQKVLEVYSEQKDLASQLKGLVLTCDCWGSSVSSPCGPDTAPIPALPHRKPVAKLSCLERVAEGILDVALMVMLTW